MPVSRRAAVRTSLLGSALAATGLAGPVGAAPASALAGVDADTALALLDEGNRRWRLRRSRHPNEGWERRRTLLTGQRPFALVLGCADSRVSPELVFDRGLGDLFTIRSAGEVLDRSVLGSVSYGVRHLRVPLVVVLGHSGCGAVAAALQAHQSGDLPHGNTRYLVERLLPVVAATPDTGGDHLRDCVDANARSVAAALRSDAELDGAVRVVPARYDLTDSRVRFLSP